MTVGVNKQRFSISEEELLEYELTANSWGVNFAIETINFGLNNSGPNNKEDTDPIKIAPPIFIFLRIFSQIIKFDFELILNLLIAFESKSLTNLNNLSIPPLKESIDTSISSLLSCLLSIIFKNSELVKTPLKKTIFESSSI